MALADELRDIVAMLIFVEPEEVPLDASFEELGVDSLGRLELISHVEQHLGRLLSENEIPALDNIVEVAQFVETIAA